jgi:thioredoxin-related protein
MMTDRSRDKKGYLYPFVYFLATGVLLTAVIIGCSDKATDPQIDDTSTRYDSVTWVGTDAIFKPTDSAKDYSLLFFLVSWCHWCRNLENVTLADQKIIDLIGRHFNACRVDPDSDSMVVYHDSLVTCRELLKIYKIHGYPTVCVFKSDSLLGKVVGYYPPEEFARRLSLFLGNK